MNHKSFEEYIKNRREVSGNLNSLSDLCHADAVALGWYDTGKQRTDLESIMMMVTELAECVEELRKPAPVIAAFDLGGKPIGVGTELADCLIRILDYCAHKDIDIENLVQVKLDHNILRGYRHGNKRY